MPPVRSENLNGFRRDTYDYSTPPPMDPSSRLWNLAENEASEVLGVDVLRRGRYRPERGRLPVGLSIGTAEGPVTGVFEVNSSTKVPKRIQGIIQPTDFISVITDPPDEWYLDFSTTGSYTSADGNITFAGSPFTNYQFVSSPTQYVYVESSDWSQTISGAYQVLGQTANVIQIQTGLGDATVVVGYGPQYEAYLPHQGGTHFGLSNARTYLTKSYPLYVRDGAWDSEIVGAQLVLNEDRRNNGWQDGITANPLADSRSMLIESIQTFGSTNNTLVLNGRHLTHYPYAKFSISYLTSVELRGLLVTNGRKFWLYSGGTTTEVYDLGSDTYKGTVWELAQISNNRYQITSPDYPSRILPLDRGTSSLDLSEAEYLSGLLPPAKPADVERVSGDIVANSDITTFNPSWVMQKNTTAGNLEGTGVVQAMVRAVNYDEGLYSDFVEVAALSDSPTLQDFPAVVNSTLAGSLQLTPTENQTIRILANENQEDDTIVQGAGASPYSECGWSPYLSPRATALEVWRTQEGGGTWHRETVIDLNPEWYTEVSQSGNNEHRLLSDDSDSEVITLSTEDLSALEPLQDQELNSNGLPPVCKQSISYQGVTFCGGRASDSVSAVSLYAVNYRFNSEGCIIYAEGHASANELNITGAGGSYADFFQYFTPRGTERVHVISSRPFDSNTVRPVATPITVLSKTSSERLQLDDVGGTGLNAATPNTAGAWTKFYIDRPYDWRYPEIQNDEEIWYSRTDLFAPESYPPRVATLSRTGDIFRKMVQIGRYICVVMDQGVHLLFFAGTLSPQLEVDTLGLSGLGTPWADSVVRVRNQLFWGGVDGIRTIDVTNAPGDSGTRGVVSLFDRGRFSDWFKDALENGDDVDGGYDPYHSCLRFRRKTADHTYQVLQYSFNTGGWTFLNDDSGSFYASSSYVESTALTSPALYSIEKSTGAIFRVNYDEDDPYDGITLRGDLGDVDNYGNTSMTWTGQFSTLLLGCVIRFTNVTTVYRRTITAATADTLTWDSIPELGNPAWDNVSFVIEPIEFRVTYAPNKGRDPKSAKTLASVRLRARVGDRTASNDTITVKAYEDFSRTAIDSDTVDIYDDGFLGKEDIDRASDVEAQGYAIGMELEKLDARDDFEIELFEMELDDHSSTVVDQEPS